MSDSESAAVKELRELQEWKISRRRENEVEEKLLRLVDAIGNEYDTREDVLRAMRDCIQIIDWDELCKR